MTSLEDSLKKIYEELPTLECVGKCQGCCGPIPIWPAEMKVIQDANYQVPEIKESERWGAACSALSSFGRCSIYNHRPLICRLWGIATEMPCPYGCQPSRQLSKPEAMAIMKRIHDLLPGTAHLTLNPRPRRSVLEL